MKPIDERYDLDAEWDNYAQHVDEMQDSYDHKQFMIESDDCFEEWLEEYGTEIESLVKNPIREKYKNFYK